MKIATLFSGGGVLDAAFEVFGMKVDLAVEGDPDRPDLSKAIADNYARNYGETHLLRTAVERVIWAPYINDDWLLLHSSPSCRNISNANHAKSETQQDIKAAHGVVNAINNLNPYYFTLEQVRGYLSTKSWAIIKGCLEEKGYGITFSIINSYYYGVPQERYRLVVTACRDGSLVGLPPMIRPVSWGEVLQPHFKDMKPSKPANAQIKALEEAREIHPSTDIFLVQRRGNHGRLPAVRHFWQPAPVVTCSIFTDDKGSNRRSFFDIWNDGQWLGLSTRDMARLQTIPDWYKLPEATAIAGAIIGNGVPTQLYAAIIRQLIRHYQSS